ncbi:MAG: D-aminoacylase, partial [Planctomycetota bacterium]
MRNYRSLFLVCCPVLLAGCSAAIEYDLVIRNGTVYDGTGSEPFIGDVAINGAVIGAVGSLADVRGRTEIEAAGLAVAPGFINMLSWANESLLHDGRA